MNGIIDSNQKIVSNGLILNLDAAQLRSYPTSGTTWTDLSGNGYNTTLVNGPTFNSANGGSIVFDGTNDYAITASITNFKSISGWIYISTPFGTNQYILDARTGSPNGYIFSGGTGPDWDQLYINGVLTTILPISPTGLSNLPIAQWFHFYYRNTAQRTGTIKLFCRFSLNEFKDGRYACFYAYNRDLTATEINQNYNATKSRFGL
jgi:hypothetical protein